MIIIVGLFWGMGTACCKDVRGQDPTRLLNNNLRCVDLSDLTSSVPLSVTQSIQILWRTEPWEHNTFDLSDNDSVGYPSVVKNDRGRNPDNRYYLYYAHHDPCSGIGCAIAENIEGPYRKLAKLVTNRKDSIVLPNPHYPILKPPVSDPSHYSSPCVIWNEDEKLWLMYFHYYNHYHDAWKAAGGQGYGHQMTGLATCLDLASHKWTVLKDPKVGKKSVWDIVPVLPTTKEKWMNSQSSYHTIQRLANGQWIAFLRGTSVDQTVQLGFASSINGRKWNYFPNNPVIHQNDGDGGQKGIYRPYFVGYLGDNKSGKQEYLIVWGESPEEADVPKVTYGYTTDFIKVRRDPRGYASWNMTSDGPITPWREGNRLYLFSGKHIQIMILPALPKALRSSKQEIQPTSGLDLPKGW
ncbi:MAG: hypothetical protein A2283_06380 [Lentisphaerae bacterium RIFOXYA12_FULL_48_11]|nr:MAG: hypothetical protein A2283_06380 [Lentisphaerae bacterium RIFOXYA12_FULL_48_11]